MTCPDHVDNTQVDPDGNSSLGRRQMSKYTRLFAALFLTSAIAACGDKGSGDTLATDTTLNRDLELANVDTGVQPSLTDVPAAAEPAPVAAAPATTPRATAPRTTTRTTPRPTATSTAPTTTSSGNVATRGTGTAERSMGTIAAGSTVSLS